MKPILFSVPMVQAILAGRKTQTRRVVLPQPAGAEEVIQHEDNFWYFLCGEKENELFSWIECVKCPYQPGDILWVRETWSETDGYYLYKADDTQDVISDYDTIKWRSSRYMPRVAARLFLRVTDVRVQRVQDISEEDAKAEGCVGVPCEHPIGRYACEDCMNTGYLEPPVMQFANLWDSINAKRGYPWADSPWVWAYTFEQIDKAIAEKSGEPVAIIPGEVTTDES